MNIQAVMLDIGGVLLDGTTPLPGAAEAIARLRAQGMPYLLLTNTTRTPHGQLLRRLADAGFALEPGQLLTPAILARAWLEGERRHPMLLIHPNLEADFTGLSGGQPDAVVVGDAGDAFTYAALNAAFRLLMDDAPLLALSGSRYFREGGELWLDAGPFVRLLEEAAGRQALQFGKPGEALFRHALERLGVPAEAVVMIGDDVESDVRGAMACGLQAILVQTGKYRPGDEARLPPGGRLAKDVLEAIELALEA